MNLLALAGASRGGGACLLTSDERCLVDEFDAGTTGGRALLPAARRCLRQAGLTVGELECLAFCLGPGSFTGLRVALAAALGLAEATGARLVGLDSLAVLHHAARERLSPGVTACCLLGAGRGLVYARRFLDGRPLEPTALLESAGLGEERPAEVYLGEADEETRRLLTEKAAYLGGFEVVRPEPLAWLALVEARAGRFLAPEEVSLAYLKTPGAVRR